MPLQEGLLDPLVAGGRGRVEHRDPVATAEVAIGTGAQQLLQTDDGALQVQLQLVASAVLADGAALAEGLPLRRQGFAGVLGHLPGDRIPFAELKQGGVVAKPVPLGLLAAVVLELEAKALQPLVVDGAVQIGVVVLVAAEHGPEPVLGVGVAAAGGCEQAVAAHQGVGPEGLQRQVAINVEHQQVAGSGVVLIALATVEVTAHPGLSLLDPLSQFLWGEVAAIPAAALLDGTESLFGSLVVMMFMYGNVCLKVHGWPSDAG
ncbi:hypothetical protein [Synechococcus sp. CBW1004]|uniref:hypothetical protein n=1 Tax=Synechococcus sp. CBW1004 TaxID=1353136 RepID=UPI0018CF6C69|nr:hypothetical protein [Synechococcus sp. CBW1004]QPN61993.1 hypothetical protein H8F25_09290 [Synechococcus sp. CBW1004]